MPQPEKVIYRLGLHALGVPGLPSSMTIDDVHIEFCRGPIRAQVTSMRQRHGLPIVFDKHMRRDSVGDGDLIALLCIEEVPVPADLDDAFGRWRARALAAAGMIAAVLDERVVGRELLEDAVLLRDGKFVLAADMRGKVRSYVPLDVNAADLVALEGLSAASVSEGSAVARASRLYRRAALEGPTADAYAMLWVAAECFSEHRSPSRRAIETALQQAGMDPAGLPVPVSTLIDLRGKIQHRGLEADDRLSMAFYEMEAVVRALIRQHMGVHGGWWPATGNPSGFADPFDAAADELVDRGRAVWHDDGLVSALEPVSQHIPRRVPNPERDPRVQLDAEFREARSLVAGVVVDALEWQAPDASLVVRCGRPRDVEQPSTMGADATSIWIAPERLQGLNDPTRPELLVNFVWDLHGFVSAALAQRSGIVSEGGGAACIEALASFARYRRFVTFGEGEESLVHIPAQRDPIAIGKLAGWAAAGDERALAAIGELPSKERELADALVAELRSDPPGPAVDILRLVASARGQG